MDIRTSKPRAKWHRVTAATLLLMLAVAGAGKVAAWTGIGIVDVGAGLALDAAAREPGDSKVADQAAVRIQQEARACIEALQDLSVRANSQAPILLTQLELLFEPATASEKELATQLRARIARGDSDEQLVEWIRNRLR